VQRENSGKKAHFPAGTNQRTRGGFLSKEAVRKGGGKSRTRYDL